MAIRTFRGIKPRIAASAFVDESAVVIGDVSIGAHTSVWPLVSIRGDVQRIMIGENTNIQDGSVLHVTQDNRFSPGGRPLTIGSCVTVGHGVVLHACTVEDLVLVGMGSTILDGAVIREGAMIGAGSLVSPNKELEGGFLYLGTPAKKVRPLTATEIEYLTFSAEHYRELKDLHQKKV